MAAVQAYFDLFESLSLEQGPTSESAIELIVLSFISFTVLYGVAHAASSLFVRHYATLSYGQQVDWCTRVTSTTHALLTAQAAFRVVLLGEGGLHDSPFHGYSTFVKVYSCVSVGYFLSDFVIILRHFRNFGTPSLNLQYLAHHLFGAVGYVICVSQSMFLYFGMFRLLSEASTPFVALHYVLNTKKRWAKGPVFLLNGVVLMTVFFAARIVGLPFYWHIAVACWHQLQAPLSLKLSFVFFSLVGDALNVVWFVGMVKNATASVAGTDEEAKQAAARFGTGQGVSESDSTGADGVASALAAKPKAE